MYVNHYDNTEEPDFTKVKKEVSKTNDLDM